jgi:hypothetical protein
MLASPRRINRIRSQVLKHLLPDTCMITPVAHVETAWGTAPGFGSPRQYAASTSIPCRMDSARHYREATVHTQPTAVNEFELHVPWDMDVRSTDVVDFNGRRYEVRKMMDNVSWQPTKSFMVSELAVGETP